MLRHASPRSLSLSLLALGVTVAGAARADPLATYPSSGQRTVVLMNNACSGDRSGNVKRAYERSPRELREGCWTVNARGNPVVTWQGGRKQELDAAKVRLEPRYALAIDAPSAPRNEPLAGSQRVQTPHALRRGEPPPAAQRAEPSRAPSDVEPSGLATGATGAPGAPGAMGAAFARPVWCKNARQPHERLICDDRGLAANDHAISLLWRSLRPTLDRNQEARYRSDFYRRLKTCGAARDCIVKEQQAQMRTYRHALGAE